MSIIEEALRRVQDPSVAPPPPTVHAPPKAPEPPPAIAHSWPTAAPGAVRPGEASAPMPLGMLAVAVLGLTAILFFGGIKWSQRPPAPRQAVVPAAPQVARAAAPAPEPAPRPQPSPVIQAPAAAVLAAAPSFALSGIIDGGSSEAYAVINNEIVRAGDRIGQATVAEVGRTTVRLRQADGTDTVLDIPR
ncbi:MAG: hypothetical protein HY601_03130 [Candidatus Omnitrophica bacterium]|nr:hypothetical protein [Candidatus Omnitrophota bacterium]